MFNAFDRPGMPHSIRYVGANFSSSNSTDAFSYRSSLYFNVFSSPGVRQNEKTPIYRLLLPIGVVITRDVVLRVDRPLHLQERRQIV